MKDNYVHSETLFWQLASAYKRVPGQNVGTLIHYLHDKIKLFHTFRYFFHISANNSFNYDWKRQIAFAAIVPYLSEWKRSTYDMYTLMLIKQDKSEYAWVNTIAGDLFQRLLKMHTISGYDKTRSLQKIEGQPARWCSPDQSKQL